MIKSNLQLLDGSPNFFDFPQSTIDNYLIDGSEKSLFQSTVKLFFDSKLSKSFIGYKYIKFHLDSDLKYLDIVRFPKYPLPGVLNLSTRKIIINISALGKRSISNLEAKDLCSLIIYSHICGSLSGRTKISDSSFNIFCEYFSAVFLKIFSKKYGITGSYIDLIPHLRFLVSLYVCVSFFDFTLKKAITKSQGISKFNMKSLEVDLKNYDLTNIKDFIRLLNDSQVMPGINIYKFVDTMIKQFGVMNIVLFEDLMRCCSTLFASTVPQNSYFSPGYQIIHKSLFDKIIKEIDIVCGKGI
jgi:hypothetical protein